MALPTPKTAHLKSLVYRFDFFNTAPSCPGAKRTLISRHAHEATFIAILFRRPRVRMCKKKSKRRNEHLWGQPPTLPLTHVTHVSPFGTHSTTTSTMSAPSHVLDAVPRSRTHPWSRRGLDLISLRRFLRQRRSLNRLVFSVTDGWGFASGGLEVWGVGGSGCNNRLSRVLALVKFSHLQRLFRKTVLVCCFT